MRRGRVVGGLIAEIMDFPAGVTPTDIYVPEIAAQWIEVSAEADVGWSLSDGTWTAPAPPAPFGADALKAAVAFRRWEAETAGVVIAGMQIATDDRSQTKILGARVQADRDSAFTVRWKGGNGTFVTLSAEEIVAISDAVLAHVQACFADEDALIEAIDAGTVTTIEQIEAHAWPGSEA